MNEKIVDEIFEKYSQRRFWDSSPAPKPKITKEEFMRKLNQIPIELRGVVGRIIDFIHKNPNCTRSAILKNSGMRKQKASHCLRHLWLLRLIKRTDGNGVKASPYRYAIDL